MTAKQNKRLFHATAADFKKIPGSPIAYWVSKNIVNDFSNSPSIKDFGNVSEGIKTGDNERFLRFWYEPSAAKFSFAKSPCGFKWYPYHKGGEFRRWFGNNYWAINWEYDGKEIKEQPNSGIQGREMQFQEFASWSKISSKGNPFRYYEKNILFDSGAPAYSCGVMTRYILGLTNSAVGIKLNNIVNPTINAQTGNIMKIPVIVSNRPKVESIVDDCILLSKKDWNSFEVSWNFVRHPLIRNVSTMAKAFDAWSEECQRRFDELKANEEELNRIFIEIYGLEDELTPDVEDRDVTVRKADLGRDIRGLISYAVGCMFGRYSLDAEGLAYAGGEWDAHKYRTFAADADNVIPVCDDEYFEDDITGRFIEFIRVVYGSGTLEENLNFIAGALGGSGSPRAIIRNYFREDFFKDHCKMYQKRPIYWLFDSGTKGGFRALIYLHRYREDTLARMRTDYVHEQQSRYRTAIDELERREQAASVSERRQIGKRLAALRAQAEETRIFEEKIHHLADMRISLDPDDGVKRNYALFGDVLAKVK